MGSDLRVYHQYSSTAWAFLVFYLKAPFDYLRVCYETFGRDACEEQSFGVI